MNDLILYHADYSTCSQKVRIALAEKNLTFTSKPMSFRKEEQLQEDYLKINPNGVVPSLVHNGKAVIDSSCILEYLEEVFDETPLSPSTPLARARMLPGFAIWRKYQPKQSELLHLIRFFYRQ